MSRTQLGILTLAVAGMSVASIGVTNAQLTSPSQTLRSDGLGKVSIGMTLKSIEQKVGKLEIDRSQDPTGHCLIALPKGSSTIHYMIISGVLSRIDVEHGEPSIIATDKGIRLGDSAQAVTKAYPSGIEKVEDQGSPVTYLLLHAEGKRDANGVGFYIESGKVTWLMSGKRSALLREEGCLG